MQAEVRKVCLDTGRGRNAGNLNHPIGNAAQTPSPAARRTPDYGILVTMATPTDITLNDVSDLVRILQERPEWLATVRHVVISDELLSVPQQLAEFIQSTNDFIRATNENFRLVYERLDRLEAGQVELRAGQAELRAGQAELRAGQAELKDNYLRQERRINSLEGRFSNFEGSDYERRLRNRLVFRAAHRFDLVRPVIAMTQDIPSIPQFTGIIHRAIRQGAITIGEADDLHEADIIIMSEDDRHVVLEVSLNADEDDLRRAVRRSRILATAANATVMPAIVTPNPSEFLRAQAEAYGVDLFSISYP